MITWAELQERQAECYLACRGVTFIGNPEGVVKRIAEVLQKITGLYEQLRAMTEREMKNSPTIMDAHAVLSQVQVEQGD